MVSIELVLAHFYFKHLIPYKPVYNMTTFNTLYHTYINVDFTNMLQIAMEKTIIILNYTGKRENYKRTTNIPQQTHMTIDFTNV